MNANQKEFYYGIGKDKDSVITEGVFERFPELIPAVGDYYWREDGKHKKMLLVGESNYFKDKESPNSDFQDAEKWYKADDAKLIPQNAHKIVSNWKGGRPFENMYKVMDKVLSEAGIEHEGYLLMEAAFYNYFLRPARDEGTHKSFIPKDIDREVAGVALAGIIDRLEPELIIFLSKKAYDEFSAYCSEKNLIFEGVVIDFVYHPSSWRWHSPENCHLKVEKLLSDYWICH